MFAACELRSSFVRIVSRIPAATVPAAAQSTLIGWGGPGSSNVPAPPLGLVAVEVSNAENHCLARLSDGSILAWGDNLWGQCSVPALAAGARLSASENPSVGADSLLLSSADEPPGR